MVYRESNTVRSRFKKITVRSRPVSVSKGRERGLHGAGSASCKSPNSGQNSPTFFPVPSLDPVKRRPRRRSFFTPRPGGTDEQKQRVTRDDHSL
jgi:hypothetical protein